MTFVLMAPASVPQLKFCYSANPGIFTLKHNANKLNSVHYIFNKQNTTILLILDSHSAIGLSGLV